MKRAILSRLQPFLAWPRSRSEAAIKGRVTMNGTFQWESIWHGGFGGMQIPGGSRQSQVGLQGLGGAEHPPSMGVVQLCIPISKGWRMLEEHLDAALDPGG